MATGYYFGARAGRQRYDQMNRAIAKLRRSDAFEEARDRARSAVEEAAELAKSAVEEGVDKARSVVESRAANSTGNGHGADEDSASGYSSSR
jgi:acetoin utilization deacetylase AcuC-like enzyme